MELPKYNIDIAALRETRFSESGSLNDMEYSFFWSGKTEGERREAGVGFAIKKDIVTKLIEMLRPASDSIVTMRLPLSNDNFATIIDVYAPTMTNPDENKEAFYNQLASVLSGILRTDKLLLMGDLNARIGSDNDKWPLVIGKHGIVKCNSNGELLLALCPEIELIVTNTMFKQKGERKTNWMHPRSRHWHMIDFINTRCRDKMDVHSTRDWSPDAEVKHGFQNTAKSTTGKGQISRPRSTQQNQIPSAIGRVLSRRWTVLSPNRKIQHQTRNGQLCSRSHTTQLKHILQARQKTPWLVRHQRPEATKSYEQKRSSPPECYKPGALDPPLQHTKMPADCYKNAPMHWS